MMSLQKLSKSFGNRVRAVDVGDFEADELVVRLGGEVAEVEDFPERHTAPIHAQSCVAEANPVDDAVDGVGVLPEAIPKLHEVALLDRAPELICQHHAVRRRPRVIEVNLDNA